MSELPRRSRTSADVDSTTGPPLLPVLPLLLLLPLLLKSAPVQLWLQFELVLPSVFLLLLLLPLLLLLLLHAAARCCTLRAAAADALPPLCPTVLRLHA